MFQFLGVIFTIIILYILVQSYINAKNRIENEKIGLVARNIAIKELNIPHSFFTHTMINNIESIKYNARALHEHSSNKYKNLTWPHLLAWAVFYEYRTNCVLYFYENKTSQNLLKSLNISKEIIFKELESDRYGIALNRVQEKEYLQLKLDRTLKIINEIQKKKDIIGSGHPDFPNLDDEHSCLSNDCEHYIEGLKDYEKLEN